MISPFTSHDASEWTSDILQYTGDVSEIVASRQFKPRLHRKDGQFRVLPVGEAGDDVMNSYMRQLRSHQGDHDDWEEVDANELSFQDSNRAFGAFKEGLTLTNGLIDSLRDETDVLRAKSIATIDTLDIRPLVRNVGAVLAASTFKADMASEMWSLAHCIHKDPKATRKESRNLANKLYSMEPGMYNEVDMTEGFKLIHERDQLILDSQEARSLSPTDIVEFEKLHRSQLADELVARSRVSGLRLKSASSFGGLLRGEGRLQTTKPMKELPELFVSLLRDFKDDTSVTEHVASDDQDNQVHERTEQAASLEQTNQGFTHARTPALSQCAVLTAFLKPDLPDGTTVNTYKAEEASDNDKLADQQRAEAFWASLKEGVTRLNG